MKFCKTAFETLCFCIYRSHDIQQIVTWHGGAACVDGGGDWDTIKRHWKISVNITVMMETAEKCSSTSEPPSRNEGEGLPQAEANNLEIVEKLSNRRASWRKETSAKAMTAIEVVAVEINLPKSATSIKKCGALNAVISQLCFIDVSNLWLQFCSDWQQKTRYRVFYSKTCFAVVGKLFCSQKPKDSRPLYCLQIY